jgi:hypothetical protein
LEISLAVKRSAVTSTRTPILLFFSSAMLFAYFVSLARGGSLLPVSPAPV